MENKSKKCKGQLTIEFLIILVVMLLLFSGISLDLITSSLEDAFDIQTGEMIKSADFLVKDSVDNLLLHGSGAKKTIVLRAPSECNYAVSSKKIIVECEIGTTSYGAYHMIVIGPDPLPTGIAYSATSPIIESGKSDAIEIIHL